jgi:hypothetical protein
MSEQGTEYLFILPGGAEMYEVVRTSSDIQKFIEQHGAARCVPLAESLKRKAYSVKITKPDGSDIVKPRCNRLQLAQIISPVTGDVKQARCIQEVVELFSAGQSRRWNYGGGVTVVVTKHNVSEAASAEGESEHTHQPSRIDGQILHD